MVVEYLALGTRYRPRHKPVAYGQPWELYAASRVIKYRGISIAEGPFFRVFAEGNHAVHEELDPETPEFRKVVKWIFGQRNIFHSGGRAVVNIDEVARLLELPKPINTKL